MAMLRQLWRGSLFTASQEAHSATISSCEENLLDCCSDRLDCSLSAGSYRSKSRLQRRFGASDWQVEEGLAFEMMALSFPSCFAVAIGLASTGAILGVFGLALPASSRFEMTGTWFLFVVAGYVQWFVLVPRFLVQRKRTAQPQ